jgi:hypothetical protein
MEEERPEKEFDNPLAQQKLPQFFPAYQPQTVILCLFLIAIAFIPIGAAVIVAGNGVSEINVPYHHIARSGAGCTQANNDGHINTTVGTTTFSRGCQTRATFTLSKGISAPSYLYYRIVGLHQNYRLYAESKSESQMRGDVDDDRDDLDDCEPFRGPTGPLGGADKAITVNGAATNYAGMTYSPCGAIAWSMYNDTTRLYKVVNKATVSQSGALPSTATLVCNGSAFTATGTATMAGNLCSKSGIALSEDVADRFKPATTDSNTWSGEGATSSDAYVANGWYAYEAGHKMPKGNDLDFMVWGRIAGIADFRKLYRVIDTDLQAGDYVFDIDEEFDTASFKGEKHLIIATTSWVGGENFTLGIVYVLLGVLSFVNAVGFLVYYLLKK